MNQGRKRGEKFSTEFKAKVLARYTKGEKVIDIARDEKVSEKSVANWVTLFRAGKLNDKGMSVHIDGAPRKRGPVKGVPRGKYKAAKKAGKKTAKKKDGDALAAPRGMADRIRMVRLELELAFLKQDKPAFDRALKTLI